MDNPAETQCPQHGFTMYPGIAAVNRFTGLSDFIGHGDVVTMSPDPTRIEIVGVLKCASCGYSVSIGENK
jgi:hypothetical protein